jgi:hypothetical protein
VREFKTPSARSFFEKFLIEKSSNSIAWHFDDTSGGSPPLLRQRNLLKVVY